MDFQKLVDSMSAMGRDTRARYHVTLAALIESLSGANPDAPVQFDDGKFPSDFDSYRGYYSDLALDSSDQPTTCAALLAETQAALGRSFDGYKGGDFFMGSDTPLWRAPYGCCGSAIVSVSKRDDGGLTLVCKEVD